MTTAISQWSKHMKRILLPGIGRFSAVTFGPLGARSQLPLTSSFCALLLGPAAGSARPAGEKEPAVKSLADYFLPQDIPLDLGVASKSQPIEQNCPPLPP